MQPRTHPGSPVRQRGACADARERSVVFSLNENWGEHNPEAQVGTPVILEVPAPERGPAAGGEVDPAAAPEDRIVAARDVGIPDWPRGIVCACVPPLKAPLPRVAVHVVEPPWIRRVAADGSRLPDAQASWIGVEVHL